MREMFIYCGAIVRMSKKFSILQLENVLKLSHPSAQGTGTPSNTMFLGSPSPRVQTYIILFNTAVHSTVSGAREVV